MPLYEYFCGECRTDFTLLQSADVNKEETACPDCGSGKVQPKFSTFASKIQGASSSGKSPAGLDDLPNKDIFKLPPPRLRSEL